MKSHRLLLPLALVAALAACKKPDEPTPPADTAATAEAPATPATEPPAAEPAPVGAAVPTADSIGIAECDDYLTRYEACVSDKVPVEARAALQQSLDATRGAWKASLGTPGAEEGLRQACVQARDSTRAAMQAYGCTDF